MSNFKDEWYKLYWHDILRYNHPDKPNNRNDKKFLIQERIDKCFI